MVETVACYRPNNQTTAYLESRLSEVCAQQGIIGKGINGIKEFTNLGVSEEKCNSMLEKYNNGEISFDEALEYIENFARKQDSAVALTTNIATGIGAIAIATVTAGAGAPIAWGSAEMLLGGAVGAGTKAGINTLERATNDIEGDALDVKLIAKDAVLGAVNGATSAVSSGVGSAARAGDFGLAVRKGVECGIECGALSGAMEYMTDVAFGDEDFSAGNLVKNTATSAFVSGSVGGVVGGGLCSAAKFGTHVKNALNSAQSDTARAIAVDSTLSSTRKVLNKAERSAINSFAAA